MDGEKEIVREVGINIDRKTAKKRDTNIRQKMIVNQRRGDRQR